MVAAVAVVGAGDDSSSDEAFEVGRLLASRGVVVVTGGLGGVMASACAGASSAGGVTLGLLPGLDRSDANEWVSVAVPTGLGELRNGLVVRAADAVVAVGGGYGTLSEIALALKAGKLVVGIGSWEIPGVVAVADAAAAVERVFATSG
ncbi:MAG TPA: TIGR00725 family protein [Solirubrobacteraceae bacterium]|nr:TIGR00725 family protein [Solirubrobacteraceae bacterium]